MAGKVPTIKSRALPAELLILQMKTTHKQIWMQPASWKQISILQNGFKSKQINNRKLKRYFFT